MSTATEPGEPRRRRGPDDPLGRYEVRGRTRAAPRLVATAALLTWR